MDPRADAVLPHGPSPNPASSQSPPPRRRLSMDEDLFYQHIMTQPPPRDANPPPYQADPQQVRGDGDVRVLQLEHRDDGQGKVKSKGKGKVKTRSKSKSKSKGKGAGTDIVGSHFIPTHIDMPPEYSCSINLEGVFMKKHEIEDTTKRAEDRRWHTTYVTLTGTALNVYNAKKDWGWGKTRDGPSISPDNPPWMKKAKLEKSYSLLYADAGIAADYTKRRYVIRIRAETDQFLLSCIELSTFNRWLEALFAAIDVALPIEDRDFPRDMSIPRMQRVRYYRTQSPPRAAPAPAPGQPNPPGQEAERPQIQHRRRRSSSPEALPDLNAEPEGHSRLRAPFATEIPQPADLEPVFDSDDEELQQHSNESSSRESASPPLLLPRLDPQHRLSTSSYPNAAIDPHSGKWFPDHQWTSAHDMLYAKLCYSNLLFRSPRKSNYIISKGKKWFVDWGTGRMVRVLPPTYGEVDYFGPWQVIHTENMRI